MPTIIKTAFLAATLAASVTAMAASHTFAFTNTKGNVAGTVTGHIDGLLDNQTSSATAIYIDSYPAGLTLFGSYGAPFNAMAWSGTYGENSFTVAGGLVTGGSFSLFSANGVNDQLYINSHCCSELGTNFLNIGNNDTLYVWNEFGIGSNGVTFDIPGAVPEPASGAMLLGGLGLLAFLARRRHA